MTQHITTYHIKTCMGKVTNGSELLFLNPQERRDFDSIGYSGKTLDGVTISRQAYLNTLGKGTFRVDQTKQDNGDLLEEFTITRLVTYLGNNVVFVVAWEYNTGGGFDWYYTAVEADAAFEREKVNCNDLQLARENWTAARYDFSTDLDPHADRVKITDEIDRLSPELFEQATIKYKAPDRSDLLNVKLEKREIRAIIAALQITINIGAEDEDFMETDLLQLMDNLADELDKES